MALEDRSLTQEIMADAFHLPLIGSGIFLELWTTSADQEQDFRVRKICVAAR